MSCNRLYSRHSKLDIVVSVLVDRAVEFFLVMEDVELPNVTTMILNCGVNQWKERKEGGKRKSLSIYYTPPAELQQAGFI